MIAFATAYAALLALALAMPRHFTQLFPGRRPNTALRTLLRAAAILALATSARAAATIWPPALAAVAWPGLLTAAALLLVLLLATRPRLAAAPLALAPLALAPLAVALIAPLLPP